MTSINITLTLAEARLAASVGVERQLQALQQRLDHRNGATDTWTLHVEGAAGELAAAKALGTYWPATVGTFHTQGDLAPGIEVRTRSRHDYDLIIRDDDPEDALYILVTGTLPHYRVHGYANGTQRDPAHRRTHGGRPAAFFIPHDALHDITTLRTHLGG
jgi:hypothetical protein